MGTCADLRSDGGDRLFCKGASGRAGPWLAWMVCILRGITLIVNFLAPENISFRHVVSLGHVPFLENKQLIRWENEAPG